MVTTSIAYRAPPTLFISYTHDDDKHREWVRKLAADLLFQGVEVRLDQFDLRLGQDLFHFMERGISDNEYIVLICTPNYKTKADNRVGGGGYETRIAAAVLADDLLTDRLLPIVLRGDRASSVPIYLKAALFLDMRDDDGYQSSLRELLAIVYQDNLKPTLGWRKQDLELLFGETNPAFDNEAKSSDHYDQPRNAPIVSDITIGRLREVSGVNEIDDLDNDRLVGEFGGAVFGFTVPWILNSVDRGIVGGTGPDKISLNKKPGGTVQLEIHLRPDRTTAVVCYCREEDWARLASPKTVSRGRIMAFVARHDVYSRPVSIPVNLIISFRNRSLPDGSDVVDIELA